MAASVGIVVALFILLFASMGRATELTFDMEPHHTSCFYAEATEGEEITVEFQVCPACNGCRHRVGSIRCSA